MTKFSNWDDDFSFSRRSLPYWKQYFKRLFSNSFCDIIDHENDIEFQKSGWDLQIVFSGFRKPLRIEIKSRRMHYYPVFKYDKRILIELKGNLTDNKNGSSLLNSNSDIWAYGFYDEVGKQILDPFVYYTQKLKDFIIKNLPDFTRPTFGTKVGNGFYRTLNGFWKYTDLEDCIFDPNYDDYKNHLGQTKLF